MCCDGIEAKPDDEVSDEPACGSEEVEGVSGGLLYGLYGVP